LPMVIEYVSLPGTSAHASMPSSLVSWPSTLTVAVPDPEAADPPPGTDTLADWLELDLLSLPPQPVKAVATRAAPEIATTNPRFTNVLLLLT
jgi:hypothetical protein